MTRDLRALAPVRRALDLPAFQFVLIVPATVLVGLVLVSAAVGVDHPGLNFGTVVTWVVWWGALLLSFALLGRGWCLVCPLGALGEWAQRASFWWRSPWTAGLERRWPRRLRTLWPATGLFVAFVFLDNGYGMANSPRLTAGLIVTIGLAAAWTGLVFERRSFCRYLCPLGVFIGLNALVSVLELRPRDPQRCRSGCRTKDCFRGNRRRYGCPMGEFPGGGLDSNLNCILCAECVRACPHDNLALRLRPPGRDLWAARTPGLDGAVAACALVGLASVVPLVTLVALPGARRLLATVLPAGLPPNDPPRLAALALLFALGLGATVGLVAAFGRLARRAAGSRGPAAAVFRRLAWALVPIGLVRWMADLLEHALRTWGSVADVTRALLLDFPWNRAVAGPVTARALADPMVVYAMQVGLLLAGLGLSLVACHRVAQRLAADRDGAVAAFAPLATLATLLTELNLWALAAGLV